MHQAGPARAFVISGGLGELAASTIMQRRLGPHAEPHHNGTPGRLRRWSEYLTTAGLVATLTAGRSRPAAIAAGACLLAGSALQRFSVFHAGIASTQDPNTSPSPNANALTNPEVGGQRGGRDDLGTDARDVQR